MSQTRHVLREDLPGKTVAVNLSAAQNEWESFQILMRADEPIEAINVVPADLVGPEGAVLKAADARLYRQHQFYIKNPSLRNDDFRADWYPDALIPFVDPVTGSPLQGARLTAAPFNLPARQTHGFWCDLYVPPGTKPGAYRGTYRATAGGGRSVEIPVTLWVWNFQLPAAPTMKTWFGNPMKGLRNYDKRHADKGDAKPTTDATAAMLQAYQMLSEHHINVDPPEFAPVAQADGTYRIPDEQVRTLREYVDRYHINVKVVSLPSEVVSDRRGSRGRLREWLAAFDRAAKELRRPDLLFVCYLREEPKRADEYQFVRTWGRAIRDAKSVVQVLVAVSPEGDPSLGELYGAVDIWCPLYAQYPTIAAAKRQALGETLWTYTTLCQAARRTPWWQTDFPLLNYRVPAWIMWRDRVRGLLYPTGMAYWDEVEDPWTEPTTRRRFNGEGSLVYPAREVGYDGLAPSLRLKALRDSIEDYEYLAMLERLGLEAEAEKIVKPLAGSWYQWDKDPMAYELARTKLAELIEKATLRK